MKLGVVRETFEGERRVIATPEVVEKWVAAGHEVWVEQGAGDRCSASDAAYEAAGAKVVETATAWTEPELVLKVHAPNDTEIDRLPEGRALISLVYPAQNSELIQRLEAKQITSFALDCVPRITRAQPMDVLSSQTGIAGYRAVLNGAQHYGRYFKGQITAAGRTPPANVLIIGAGVAGLAAIATARDLGAQVKVFDVRPPVKEEVESLGATFLEIESEESGEGVGGYAKEMGKKSQDAQHELFRKEAANTDLVITTALIPGKPAPLLLPKEVVEALKPGSVIVDLAARAGGNCELTQPGEVVDHQGVTILGPTLIESELPRQASDFLGQNVTRFLTLLSPEGEMNVDLEDDIIRCMLITREGKTHWPPENIPQPDKPKPGTTAAAPVTMNEPEDSGVGKYMFAAAILGLTLLVGAKAPKDFIEHYTVFVLACVIGYNVVWGVTHSLHTPLMAVTNAISGIIVLGGVLLALTTVSKAVLWLSLVAVLVASINVFGGFLVTHRMLKMFRSDKDRKGGKA